MCTKPGKSEYIWCTKQAFFPDLVGLRLMLEKSSVFCAGFAHRFCTSCAQDSGIQALLDFGHGGADVGVEIDFFFDLFDGVDSGGVIFAAQFSGYFGEAQV